MGEREREWRSLHKRITAAERNEDEGWIGRSKESVGRASVQGSIAGHRRSGGGGGGSGGPLYCSSPGSTSCPSSSVQMRPQYPMSRSCVRPRARPAGTASPFTTNTIIQVQRAAAAAAQPMGGNPEMPTLLPCRCRHSLRFADSKLEIPRAGVCGDRTGATSVISTGKIEDTGCNAKLSRCRNNRRNRWVVRQRGEEPFRPNQRNNHDELSNY